ncbi:TonB-dependent receptor [Luteimonas sp. SX5]|uniref:TonB-dependent receptor n=1 Tax=Luteimonas galliterrae TaxID=2940486 RepID=A0ABT0MKM3_9GAMM|nr:TonB-dependent receptor [Luteimonas galliterrae]MCL1635429.1 TonB-dependent receptor [Luteimonas galliterrae]
MSLKPHILGVSLRRALIGACALPFAFSAWAQTAPAAAQQDPAARDAVTLDRIIVTAQSREQELQDVPIALQVVTDQLIDDVAAEDLGDIDSFVPGLVVNSNQPTQPSFQLRGIQTDDFGIGTDPAVGVYVDGVYAGRGGGVLLPFTDVERIEVLKGPQGTLFGRNTAAGAISIITRKPVDEFEGRARLRLGNYGKAYLEGMLNVPTGEDSAFRFNALANHSDGWVRDSVTGQDLNPEDNWATRAAFKTTFGDATHLFLSWDHEKLDQRAQVTTGIVSLPAAPGVPPLPVDETAYLDPRKIATSNDAEGSREYRRFDGVTLIVDHAFEWGSLTSTTSWRDYDSENRAVDEDGTNRRNLYVDSTNTESNHSVYQEFKFAGSTDRIDWVAGASYFQESAKQTSEVNTFTDAVDTILSNLGQAPGGLFGPISDLAGSFGIPVTLRGHRWNEAFRNTLDTKAYAVYGDVIWHVNDKFNLTLGGRFTRDEKDFTWFNSLRYAPSLDLALDQLQFLGFFDAIGLPREQFVFDVAFIDPPALLNKGIKNSASQSWNDFSPRLVADYHFDDNTMGFASLAKGYKAGGFNSLQIGSEFENEEVWNFETGIKKALPDYRLSFNASAFYYVYDNRQAVVLDMTTEIPRFVVDTSDLEAWGLDFDARWQATEGLGLDFNAEYIDSTYKEYVNPQGVDLAGEPTGTPHWSFAAGIDYLWNLGDNGDVRFVLRHAYRGKTRCNDESVSQGACGVSPALDLGEAQNLTDARIAWTSAQGRWGWAIYGNNLGDNQYINSLGTYGKTVLGTVGARITEPRTYGMEVSLKF